MDDWDEGFSPKHEPRAKLQYERPIEQTITPSYTRPSPTEQLEPSNYHDPNIPLNSSSVSKYYSKYSSPKPNDFISRKECRIYVGNLSYETGWEELKQHMEKVGEVLKVDILTLPGGTRSKGCGVVEFSSPEMAQDAIRELNETTILGRPMYLREDRENEVKTFDSASARPPSAQHPDSKQLFVGNLAYSVSWQDLKDLFREVGNVVRSDIMENAERRSKGCGIIVFETAEEADKAIATFDGYEWLGRKLEVREDRKPDKFRGSFGRRDRGDYHHSGRPDRRSLRMDPYDRYAEHGYPERGYADRGYPERGYPERGGYPRERDPYDRMMPRGRPSYPPAPVGRGYYMQEYPPAYPPYGYMPPSAYPYPAYPSDYGNIFKKIKF